MPAVFMDLVAQANTLPILDRARLVETLIESMTHTDQCVEALWAAEAEDRIDAIGRGDIDLAHEPALISAFRARQQ